MIPTRTRDPIPGMRKTSSMITTLPTRNPNSTALTVKNGMRALRRTWKVTRRRSETPLERARLDEVRGTSPR